MKPGIFLQGLIVLLGCALIEMFGGGFLQGAEDYLTTLLPGTILIVPPLLDLRGNINGAFASRLGTSLHLGVVSPRRWRTPALKVNLISTLVLSFIASLSVGFFGSVVGYFTATGTIPLSKMLLIALIAGFTSGVIMVLLTVGVAFLSHKHGWDPDSVTAPLMASIGDLLTIICILLAVWVVSLV